jgi:hypothetical protein
LDTNFRQLKKTHDLKKSPARVSRRFSQKSPNNLSRRNEQIITNPEEFNGQGRNEMATKQIGTLRFQKI